MKCQYLFRAFLVFCMITICLSYALADETIIPLSDPVQITAPGGSTSRLLYKPVIVFPDSTININQAILEVTVNLPEQESTFVVVRVSPITVEWSRDNVSWNSPWAVPGGSFEDAPYAEYALLATGQKTLHIDLTDLWMRWADGRLPYLGFMVGFPEYSQGTVSLTHVEGDPGLPPKITVDYTPINAE
jgi:hypothetical protein